MNRKIFAAATLAVTTLTIAAGPAPERWNIDVPHTGIAFSVKHFFTPVRGSFADYDVELLYDREHPENSSVRAVIQVASIHTANERRDNHLRSGDFFEAEGHGTITFHSEDVRKVGEDQLLVRGPLTIKGTTRIVELPVKILGVMDVPAEMQQMLGGVTQIASFETGLTIDRRDFGVGVGNWAATAVVGKDVEISIAVEANR